ncbi:MAG: SDR family oxidoreductase [Clostridium sp.]|jgi:gluconate 5-dehydrogenase|nr:SDR family oxidoreductase [Clostridium sp.]
MFDLTGQVAVVTGASSGLGVQMAKALARQGADVAILARRGDVLNEVKGEIETLGVRCISVVCDVTKIEAVQEAAIIVQKEFGRVDILVNNAGSGSTTPLESISVSDWNYDIDVDLTGVFLMTQVFGKLMIEQNYGRIINIASMYGLVGNTAIPSAAYHAAKGAAVNFTRAVAAEWAKYGINANCICPGYFATELTKDTLDTEDFKVYMQRSVPLGRYGNEGELDAACIFLASKESSYVTGAILPVDGGYTCV